MGLRLRGGDDAQRSALLSDGALADDLTYIHSAGQLQNKAEVIQSITSGKTIIERMDYSDTSVRFYGKTALVRGRVDLYHSSTNIVHMNVLHVWVKSPQGWQMVARQATRLASGERSAQNSSGTGKRSYVAHCRLLGPRPTDRSEATSWRASASSACWSHRRAVR